MPNEAKCPPADLDRCQAMVLNVSSFMASGGCSQVERCTNAPSTIAYDILPGADGVRRHMSLCEGCRETLDSSLAAGIGFMPIEGSVRKEWGMACPQCGHDDSICVEATVMCSIDSDGTKPRGDRGWTPESPCVCGICTYVGKVKDFHIFGGEEEQDNEAQENEAQET